MAKRIGESPADDSHGWILAQVVYDWWRHKIPRYIGITVFLEMVYYRQAFLNTAYSYLTVVDHRPPRLHSPAAGTLRW